MSSVFPITDDPRYRRYTASAGQTVFTIPFPFLQNDDIKVYRQAAANIYTVFPPSDYVLAGANNPAGGTVTFNAPRAAGDIILVLGAAVLDRLTSIVRDGKFSSALTDGEFDRIRIIEQEFRRDAARALKVDYGGVAPTFASDLQNGDVLMMLNGNITKGPQAEHINNAEQNAIAAEQSAAAAATSETNAEASENLAARWASAPEDEQVIPGSGLFSAYHWYRKTLAIWNLVVGGTATAFAAAVHGAPAKSTPVDADEFGVVDSQAAWSLKKVSLSGIISAIFDPARTITGALTIQRALAAFYAGIRIHNTGAHDAAIQIAAGNRGFSTQHVEFGQRNTTGSAYIWVAGKQWVMNTSGDTSLPNSGILYGSGDLYVTFGGYNTLLSTIMGRMKTVRLGSSASQNVNRSGWNIAPTGAPVTGLFKDGAGEILNMEYRVIQQTDLFGNWYNISAI